MPQPRITLRDLVPEQILDKDPPTPPVSDTESSSPGPMTGASPKEKGEHWCFFYFHVKKYCIDSLLKHVFQTVHFNRQEFFPY